MIYLHTGCEHSEAWDEGFKETLDKWGCNYTLGRLEDVEPESADIFIGRLNESCRELKDLYIKRAGQYRRMWPEPLAMWLYDDKIRQVEWLKNQTIRTPKQKVVLESKDVTMLPCVQKLAHGSASKNVKMVYSIDEVEYPSVHQEFCEGNDSDYRITIIGDYAMGSRRMNRVGDFRASGSNNCITLDELPLEIVQMSAKLCLEHSFTTMAFDYLKRGNEWVMIEMSYTYPIYSITRDCNFCIDTRTMERIEGTPDPVSMILSRFLHIKYL